MSSKAYSNIVFIPGQKYDIKGSRNQITITGEYVGINENGDYLFKNKQWFNAKKTLGLIFLPIILGIQKRICGHFLLRHVKMDEKGK
jgi:hypothetical protein